MTHCCEQMKRQVEHSCDVHSDLSECPDSLIVRHGETGEFGLAFTMEAALRRRWSQRLGSGLDSDLSPTSSDSDASVAVGTRGRATKLGLSPSCRNCGSGSKRSFRWDTYAQMLS